MPSRGVWPNDATLALPKCGLSLAFVILMGIKRLPRISNYWSRDSLIHVGVPGMNQYMSVTRFWAVWSNLHVVDNESIVASSDLSRKIQPVVDALSSSFIKCYSPGQELSVDEAMVKYKGCVGGKVVMPKKPVKKGFKIWCCSCSCCGYLCTFQVYNGKPTDLLTGKKNSRKRLGNESSERPCVSLCRPESCDLLRQFLL